MKQFLFSLLTVMRVLLEGDTSVRTEVTAIEYQRRHQVQNRQGFYRFVGFRCQQLRYIVSRSRWYLRNRTLYLYRVEMVSIDNKTVTDHHVGYYPHMGPRFMVNTTYPHWRAVNAHIDSLMMSNQRLA